jgi:hypothetical protein
MIAGGIERAITSSYSLGGPSRRKQSIVESG